MFARLAIEEDVDAVVELARMQVNETLPHHAPYFDPECVRETFEQYLASANPTIVVVEDQRAVVAFLQIDVYTYSFRRGFFTGQEVIYVRPDKRGTRAAAHLKQFYVDWADRLGAIENFMGVANGRKVEAFARAARKHGFETVGVQLRRIPEQSHG